jgi:Fur family ferric uptake transcriptional regulator
MDDDSRYLDAFETFLRKQGLRLTRQRRQTARVVLSARTHVTADQLADEARASKQSVGRATIYRTLELLRQAGLVRGHDFGQGTVLYEPVLDRTHHDHMRCTECGSILEFRCARIEKLQEEIASRHGFLLVSHRLEMFGVCKPCRSRRRTPL